VNLVADDVTDLTPDWLSAALGFTVSAVEAERIGTGQMGASWRLMLTCEREDAPRTLVAKLAAGDKAARARVSVGFAREVGFYTELAPTLAVRTPRCWYGAISDDTTSFTLLLDDLAPARPGVQVDGRGISDARGAVRNLAALHAPRWNDPTLYDYDFIDRTEPAVAEMLGAAVVDATEQFVARYEAGLGAGNIATLRDAARATAAWYVARPEPFAVVHGDYRLDNLMFPPEGEDVAALDWQSVTAAPPGRDVGYFLGTSLETPARRDAEDELVDDYHAALAARGVDGYTRDRCFEDYRLGQLQGPMITILGAIYATAERSDAADQMFLAMATRLGAAIRDLRSLDLL
jgi:hypothetical protein